MMRYLAEVQKQTKFLGSSKAKLKLLAFQQSDQSWSAVCGDEVISAEEANIFNAGTLVFLELSNNKQIWRIEIAARQLVNILQNLSRQLEECKSEQEETQYFRLHLMYQSQQLNRREMKIEALRKQMEQQRQEIEQQRQQLEAERKKIESQLSQHQPKLGDAVLGGQRRSQLRRSKTEL